MKTHLRLLASGLIFAALGLSTIRVLADTGLPDKSPAAEGFSAARLERVPAMLKREIDAQHYAGAVWLIARDGGAVSHGAVGWSDVPAHVAMTEDSVFRIFSMTKIVTTVTVLTLVEEGRINLDDPVEKYLPQLAKRQVFVGGTAEAPQLEPATGSITIRQLLTHTSGLTYDIFATDALKKIWLKADLWHSHTLKEFVDRAATLPLAHQPGAHWTYGINMDILGAVVEAVTGQDLETVMRERIFAPLGMKHTSFKLNADLAAHLAAIHHRTPAGSLEKDEGMGAIEFPSGGGGLFSTLHDYARFAQMLLNGGELDGVRVLGRKTIEMMTNNQIAGLTPLPNAVVRIPPAFGFGVRIRPEDSHNSGALGTPGEFGWDGAVTTFVSMDPKERMLVIVLLQHVPWNEDGIYEKFQNVAYQALEK